MHKTNDSKFSYHKSALSFNIIIGYGLKHNHPPLVQCIPPFIQYNNWIWIETHHMTITSFALIISSNLTIGCGLKRRIVVVCITYTPLIQPKNWMWIETL